MTLNNLPPPRDPELRRQFIMRMRDHVLDADLHVDRCREDLEIAIRALREAVKTRDALAQQLARAIEVEEAA